MLKFIEFLSEGTFVGIRLDQASQDMIKKYQYVNGIKNPITGENLHVTVIYSKKTMPDIEVAGNLDAPYIASLGKLQNYNGALVCELDCPDLEMKHTYLLNKFNGTHDYDSYSPHLSLAYDFDGDIESLNPLCGNITLINEYTENSK